MSDTIDFDAEAARRVQRAYLTPDIVAQRQEVLRELDPRPGETVLDIGVGPGLLAEDLAEAVGSTGRMIGIDASLPMVEMSRQRCSENPWTHFEVADACELPCETGSVDRAVSTQVYEYVEDMPRALEELFRVLRPGGQALILDTDYDSFVLRSSDEALTARILDAWDAHFVHRDLPRHLSGLLREAGFDVSRRTVMPLLNADYHHDTFSYGLLRFMAGFAVGGGVEKSETKRWIAELDELGERGDFFFSLNRYLFVATKPA
ncbi:MAG: methyltransferase domain-containing protein [Acidobacteriota bacterium]